MLLSDETRDEREVQDMINKFPKKHQKYIKDAYKEGNRYSVVIEFEDGFTRSIGGWNFSEVKSYVKDIIEINRNIEY